LCMTRLPFDRRASNADPSLTHPSERVDSLPMKMLVAHRQCVWHWILFKSQMLIALKPPAKPESGVIRSMSLTSYQL
jgi:hypothetical protein